MMMNEYQIVFNEFLSGYSGLSGNILRFSQMIAPSVFPVLFVSLALSVAITIYRNVVK